MGGFDGQGNEFVLDMGVCWKPVARGDRMVRAAKETDNLGSRNEIKEA